MLPTFERRVDQIDWKQRRKEQENFALMFKEVALPIVDRFRLILIREKERGDQI